MSETGKTGTAKKVFGITGIFMAIGALSAGCIILITAQSTAIMAAKMIEMRGHLTTMVDYTCTTCGLTGSIAEGTSDTRDGTECGYISGQAVRCKGTYTTKKRNMTDAEKEEIKGDIKAWERMKAQATPIGTRGIVAVIAGILMILGAVGCLKNQVWGLPVLGITFLLALVTIITGASAIIKTYSSH